MKMFLEILACVFISFLVIVTLIYFSYQYYRTIIDFENGDTILIEDIC